MMSFFTPMPSFFLPLPFPRSARTLLRPAEPFNAIVER
jgi:hypothetical protein